MAANPFDQFDPKPAPVPTANPFDQFDAPKAPRPTGPNPYNVGNLREVGSSQFRSFASPEEGVAANVQNLLAYNKRGINTVSKIISTWAPPSDNNPTAAYIANVSRALGVDPNAPLNMQDPAVMSKLITAIGVQEKGQRAFGSTFTPESISAGVNMGLGQSARKAEPQKATPNPFDQFDVPAAAQPAKDSQKPANTISQPAEESQKPANTIQAKMTPEKWSAIGGRGQPIKKPESVMAGYVAGQGKQEPLPSAERYVVDPKFIQAVETELNAVPKESRDKVLARLVQRNDAYGRAARDIQGRYQAMDKLTPEAQQVFDPRLEAQARKLEVKGGMDPQSAKAWAAQSLRRGVTPQVLPSAVRDVAAEQAALAGQQVKQEMEGAGFGARVGAEIGTRARQTGLGLAQIYADVAGDNELQKNLSYYRKLETAKGEAIPKGESIAERSAQQAIASLGGQAPMMVLGAMTGTAIPVLAQAGIEVFSQNYGQGRSAGLKPNEAGSRAGLMAVSEILFERYGLGDQLKAIRGVIDRVPTKDLSGYLTAAFLKEIPSEQATTLSQFLVDKLPGLGLNQNAGLKDYMEQAAETLRQTVIQSGASNAAIYGASKSERAFSENVLPAVSSKMAVARAIGKDAERVEPTMAGLRAQSAVDGTQTVRTGRTEPTISTEFVAPERPGRIEPTVGAGTLPPTPSDRVEPTMGGAPATPAAPTTVPVVPGMPTGDEIEELPVTPVTRTAPAAEAPKAEPKTKAPPVTGVTGATPASELPFTPTGKGPSFKGSVAPTTAAARLPDTPTVAPVKPAKEFEPAAPQHTLSGLPIVEAPIKDLKLSKDVPQFKAEANAEGVVEPLGGKFERTGVAPIQLWKRLDGSLEVISGRHRLDLAKRSGESTIPAQIHDEAKGFTLDQATTLDAELNIRDGQGKAKDYVNYFQGSKITREEANARGLLARALGKRSYGVATQGSEELIAAIRSDKIDDKTAYEIAINAPGDSRLQAVGIKAIMDGKSANIATNMMQAVKALATENDTTTDMFGFDDSAIKEAEEMAKIAAKKQREIQDRLSAISGAAKRPEIARAEGVDIKDLESVKRGIAGLTGLKAVWDNWSTNPELIAAIRAARGTPAPAFKLTSESEAERQTREDKEAAETQRKRDAEQEAERRAKADRERDEFVLTGSDRTADEAEARGQEDLFAAPKEPAKKVNVGTVVRQFDVNDNFSYKIVKTADGYMAGIYSKKLKQYLKDEEYPAVGYGTQNVSDEDINEFIQDADKSIEILKQGGQKEIIETVKELSELEQKQSQATDEPAKKPEQDKPNEKDSGFRGASDKEVSDVAGAFEAAKEFQDDDKVTRVFDAPKKSDIVRIEDRTRVFVKDAGYMTVAQAKQRIAAWKKNASDQGKTSRNADKVVLSLFDATGEWSKPWEEAGYQVYRFDIQTDPEFGDVTKFSTEFFNDMYGAFEGNDIYAILAACPCTDFASSGARHFAAKDADGRTIESVQLVRHTLATVEFFKPAVWAIENPVGRIEKLTGLPPWRLSFNPNHFGDPYTKKTLLWGRFNADLPIAPVEPTEGSKMHRMYGGKSQETKNARSVTPEGFAYSFFAANNAIDHPVMALANKYDMMDRAVFQKALDAGMSENGISEVVDDFYYDQEYAEAAQALDEAIAEINALKDANVSAPTEIKTGDSVREIPLPDDMLVRVFKTSDGYGAGLYDIDSGKFVDGSITRYKGKTALGKANKKADEMAQEVVSKEPAKESEAESKVLDQKVQEQLNKMLDDFMVGDFVRMGNAPGVVIGLDGDYVRFRPDAAKSPKAYQRVAKKSLTFVARPDTTSETAYSKEQDKKFGEEAGQLNANMGNLIQLLGANMYASALTDVSIKELLQNAFDAVKGATVSVNAQGQKITPLYKSGNIEISINRDDRTISIKDDARGMTPEIVRQAFFTVAGSDKSDLPPSMRSGGLGLAKMGFMLGSKRLQLDTVRDGVRVTVDTTAQDIANSKFVIKKSPAPKSEHGTTVTVTIPETYTDPKTGDERPIYFPYSVGSIAPLNKPLIGPVNVTTSLTSYGSTDTVQLPVGENFPKDKYSVFKANFEWGSADIYFGKARNNGSDWDISHQVLSSGVYQFSPAFALNNEKIPYDIIVNIKPDVDARHPDYPFENSRERFKGRLEKDIAALTSYLGQIARGYEAADLQETFKDIVSMPRVEAGVEIVNLAGKLQKSFDKGAVSKPAELKPLPKEVTITADAVTDTQTKKVLVDVAAKEAEKQKESTFKGEAAPKATDFMIEMKQDPKLPIFHNNTNVDYVAIGKEYGDPEKFFAELGTLMVEMKEELAKSGMYGYSVLAPDNLFFAGIAIDKGYGGIHIKVPYKAVMINPFYSFGARTLFGVKEQLLDTMIHEIAHTGSMDHGVAHNSQMIKVKQYLADEGLYDYYRDTLLDILSRHESTFTAMRDAYGQSTTGNTAKSLEDYGKDVAAASSRGNRGSNQYPPGDVPPGGGPVGGQNLQGPQAPSGSSQVGGGTGATRGAQEQRLMQRYSRPHTPMLDNTPVMTFLTNAYTNGKDFVTDAVTSPIQTAAAAERNVTDGLLSARNLTSWYGAGLESRDFARYQGQLRTSADIVTSSVALDNAIRSGNIGVEVIFSGGLEYNAALGNFVAVKRDLGMRGVYEAEAAIKKRLGNQLGTDIVQGYLEAKRSISIMDELRERTDALERAEQNLEAMEAMMAPPEDIAEAKKAVDELKVDLEAINNAASSVNMSEEEMYEFAALDEKHPELRTLMDNWTAVNQNLLSVWRQVGLISQGRYETLSAIKDYVPWYRIMNDNEDIHSAGQAVQSTTRSLVNIGREKLFKSGRPRNVVDIIATAGQQDFKIQPTSVVKVKVNGKRISPDLVTATPQGDVRINMALEAGDLVTFETNREIQNIIDNMTRNVMRMTMNGIRQFASNRIVLEYAVRNAEGKIRVYPSVNPEEGKFNWMVNGKKVVVQIQDPVVVASIYGMENINLRMWAPMAAVANFTRRGVTLSGVFQVKQVFKDAPTAALVTGVRNPIALIGGVWKGFLTSLIQPGMKKAGVNVDPVIDILKAAGIGGFHSPARTPEAEIKRRLGIMNRNVYSAVIKTLDHIGDSSDMAQRVGVYKRVMAETGDQTQALYQAANVINFMHHGSAGFAQAAVKTVPFIGAWMNSTDVLLNSLQGGGLKGMSRKKAIARLAVAATTLSTLTLLYCMLAGGDPEYDELDDQTKLRNIMIPGTKIVMPINTSAALIFKAIPELIYNKITRDGTKNENDTRRLRRALAEFARDALLGPEPIPAGVKTLLEVGINHSFFTGRQVTPESLKDVEAAEQYVASTSELGKKLSAMTAIPGTSKRVLNPMDADHIVRGLFGTAGAMAQWVSNSIEASTRPAPSPREMPITGSFKREEVPRGNEDLFYDFKEIVMEKHKTLQKMIDREDYKAADKYIEKHGDIDGMYEYISETEEELKEINSEIRRLGESKDKTMTPQARRKEIVEMQRLRNELLAPIKGLRVETFKNVKRQEALTE